MTSAETPLRPDAFIKTDDQKMSNIEKHFHAIMEEMGLDMTDDSLQGTPHRVAKCLSKKYFQD
jgi:GTP cyclohydrolase I